VKLADLTTPALVVDRVRLRRNAERMARRASDAGVALRPHMKTGKSARVAELATAGHGGITVSTLAEAAYFLERGFRDITWAVCAVPSKLGRVSELQREHDVTINLITDDAGAARGLAARAAELNQEFRLLIEIDSGEHRTGIHCDAPALLEIADVISKAPHLVLEGVLTHGGHSYDCHSIAEIKQVAEQERSSVVTAASRLRAAQYPCSTISAGSTPTAVHADSFEGLTEIRPGVYLFFDLAQHGRQCCGVDEIAISVLSTVIGHNRANRRILIDAGGLALSKDTSANAFLPDAGYGWVFDEACTARIGDLRIATADQEHGFVEGGDLPYDRLPIGARVRILPNHACMTAAAYDRYAVVDGDDEVVDTWDRTHGW